MIKMEKIFLEMIIITQKIIILMNQRKHECAVVGGSVQYVGAVPCQT